MEFQLNWNARSVPRSGMFMPTPVGKYRKQKYLSKNKVVYHNPESNYYLYNRRGHEWVVSLYLCHHYFLMKLLEPLIYIKPVIYIFITGW